ncbi:colanic acid biosynthesis glycosyltransferase WcaL [Microbacterium sp. dk485]|uniref:exopolysaccharide biosynthesis GT4 family glycosyltransferase EpsE n=1 Tax=Microbacterium sp. dk485 TaxID=2560021 RepID=UPI001073CF5D|nr:exopolysaccharide biosynthesis GT4 family glycosyltransferase EpsE [Microbacterium sp. dk485]TFV84073.1 colanic acid biosynthesis glycosyltransferase WcaL [Microbacterium sp. dk485]
MTPPAATPTLAYLVPEFPGQTHTFFWRELEALDAAGVDVDLLSTSPPTSGAGHPWRDAATARTSYLSRPSAADAGRAAGVLARAVGAGRLPAALRRAGGGVRERGVVLLAAAVLAARARARGWRHVHVHSSANSARVAMVAAALGDITYSVTLHGPLADYGPGQADKWRHAAFGLVITERLRVELAAALGEDLVERVRLAPMGIRLADTERSRPYEPWTGEGPALLFSCGRLNPAKGHDTLIRAVSVLVDAGVPVRLAIAGEDEQGGDGYRARLEGLIDELGMRAHVRLLGAVGEDVVRASLEEAHVFALASRGEPLGVAIMEAMGAAVPVVVGDGGGVRELVAPGTGLLVDPAEPRAIADAVRRLLMAPEEARAVGERARAHVRARFTSEASARVLADAVAELHGARRRVVGT